MKVLCTKCKKIYKMPGNTLLPTKLLFPIILLVIASVLIPDQFRNSFNIYFTIISIIALIGAAILFWNYYKNAWNCTICDGKGALLKLNSDKAMKYIEDNNISIEEAYVEDEKQPWETDKP